MDFAVLRDWAPWITGGALIGAALAGISDTDVLLIVFGGGLLLVAAQMGLGNPNWRIAPDLPTGAPRALIAGAIGLLSAMMALAAARSASL